MALQLELIRHADARSKDPGGSDLERELSPLGQRKVLILGERLRDRGQFPDRVWCSPAVRTRSTLAALGYDFTSRAVDEPRLYEASLDTLLDLVAEMRQLAGHALLVGHNPGLQDLMAFLLGPQAPAMVTCAHARLSIPDRPARPLRGSGRLLEYWAP
jgi:phosphohistidine phosphatase